MEDVMNAPLNGQGTEEQVDETADELVAARKKLNELSREDGPMLSLTKKDVGLLMQLVHVPDQADAAKVYLNLLATADFISEEERWKHVNAFDESVRLGMDLWQNVRYLQSNVAINRNGHRSSRAAMIMDTLSHQKFSSNAGAKGRTPSGANNPRSPIS